MRGEEPRLIGWVASYHLTEHFVFTKEITDRCAVGIDIPDQSARGNGYSYQALYSYKLRFTVPDGYLAYLNDHTFSVPLTDVRFLEFFRLGDVKKKLDKK